MPLRSTRHEIVMPGGVSSVKTGGVFVDDAPPPSGFRVVDEGGPDVLRGNASQVVHTSFNRYLLANGESHSPIMAVDVDPSTGQPAVAVRTGEKAHLWAAAASGDVLLVRQSLDGKIFRVAPDFSGAVVLPAARRGHSIATDGRWIVAPGESNTLPGRVTLIDARTHLVQARADAAEVWPEKSTYCCAFDPLDPEVVYVGVSGKGIYRFAIAGGALSLRGRLVDGTAGSDFSVRGRLLWVSKGNEIRVWDWTIDDAPAVVASYAGAPLGKFTMRFGASALSPDGKFLAVTQKYVTETGGEVQDARRGIAIFDVSSAPVHLALGLWEFEGRWHDAWFPAWHESGRELLVSYFRVGVGVWRWDPDTRKLAAAGRTPTAGEGADSVFVRDASKWSTITWAKEVVFGSVRSAAGKWETVDFMAPVKAGDQGRYVVWRDRPLQLFTPRSMRHWQPPTPDEPFLIQGPVSLGLPQQWDARLFSRAGKRYLALAGESGLHIYEDRTVAPGLPSSATLVKVGVAPLSVFAGTDLAGSVLRAVEISGDYAWVVLARNKRLPGIAAFNLSNLAAPVLAYTESWRGESGHADGWFENGNMTSIASFGGRVYAGAGRGGILEYDGLSRVAAYFANQVTATSVAIRADGVGAFAHYWQPDPPLPRPYEQGAHFFDARARGALTRIGQYPTPGGPEMWTVRADGDRFVVTSLYGARSLRVEV